MSAAPHDQAADLREAVRAWRQTEVRTHPRIATGSSETVTAPVAIVPCGTGVSPLPTVLCGTGVSPVSIAPCGTGAPPVAIVPCGTSASSLAASPPTRADADPWTAGPVPMARPLSSDTQTCRLAAPVVAISSGKGGVGKTHLSVNLALALGRRGRRVLLLDADAGTANADLVLSVDPAPGLRDLLDERCTAERVARLVAPGVRFVAGTSGGGGRVDDVLADELALRQTITRLAGDCDIVLLDCGAGVGPTVRGPVAACDLLLLVATPERTAMTDAYALVKTLHQSGWWPRLAPDRPSWLGAAPDRPRAAAVVVNQAAGAAEARQIAERLQSVAQRFLAFHLDDAGFVRADHHVPEALRRRRPFLEAYPRSHAARDVAILAERLDRLAPMRRG